MLPSDVWKEYWQVEPAMLAPGWPWTQVSHVRSLEGGESKKPQFAQRMASVTGAKTSSFQGLGSPS